MEAEQGLGFTPDIVSPRSILRTIAEPFDRNIRKAQAKQTFTNDTSKITDRMRRLEYNPSRISKGIMASNPALVNQATDAMAYNPSQEQEPPEPIIPQEAQEQPQAEATQSNLLQKIAMAESSGNPNAKNPNSTASGLYQFTNPTWASMVKKYGNQHDIKFKDKNNPQAQEIMMQYLLQENADYLANKGIEANDGHLYLAHFLGAPQAAKLIKRLGTGQSAASLLPSAAKVNNRDFFEKGRPLTVEELYNRKIKKVG
jgi:hypothetical protein